MNEQEKPFFHQRRYLVDRRFQMKYTLMVMVVSSIIFAGLGYQVYQTAATNTEILKIQNLDVKAMVDASDHRMLILLLAAFVLQIASLFVLGILITHRIAGPVFRVQKYLDEMADTGEVKPLNPIRNRDEFREFFDSLTRVVEMMKKRTDRQKGKLKELRDAMDANDTNRAKSLAGELLSLL